MERRRICLHKNIVSDITQAYAEMPIALNMYSFLLTFFRCLLLPSLRVSRSPLLFAYPHPHFCTFSVPHVCYSLGIHAVPKNLLIRYERFLITRARILQVATRSRIGVHVSE